VGEVHRHWPHFCYAIAGTAMPFFLVSTVRGLPGWLHWGSLPFPWSQVAFELSRPALLALAALPVLAAALIINQAVHLRFLIRTAAINLALITFGHYLPDLCPWVNLPEAGNPYSRTLIFPPILLLFSNFLVSAWLGCPLPRRAPLHAAKAKAAIEQV
jgi:hypothetical protein